MFSSLVFRLLKLSVLFLKFALLVVSGKCFVSILKRTWTKFCFRFFPALFEWGVLRKDTLGDFLWVHRRVICCQETIFRALSSEKGIDLNRPLNHCVNIIVAVSISE